MESINIHIRPGTMDADIVSEMQRDVYHVADYVSDGDWVIDVGAYIGVFALYVKQICPGARILCLEPIPDNFTALKANVSRDVIVEQFALVGKAGTVTIYDFGPEASACHSIYDLGVKGAKPVEVHGETLSQLMQRYEINQIRFLKLDCQGTEFECIPNTSHAILANIDYIAMEVHRYIANANTLLGTIPDYATKAHRLYHHLLKTHIPIHGDIESDSIQVWANRKLVTLKTKIRFNVVLWYRQIKHLLRRGLGSAMYKLRRLWGE